MGEITSKGKVNIKELVQPLVPNLKIETNITKQSPEIAQAVDNGGAGDQGIMIGYACNETPNYMPYGYEWVRSLCRGLFACHPNDGKVQATFDNQKLTAVVVSWCGVKTATLKDEVWNDFMTDLERKENPELFINPAGDWNIGGFDADTGLTGRKVAIDNYGSRVPIGGGSFSGKDPTKVDRSAAYMARKIAVEQVRLIGCRESMVKVAYAIGKPEPVMCSVILDGEEVEYPSERFYPQNIIKELDLRKPQYAQTAEWGAFGNGFNWL